jgi:hypothetical protein
VEVRDKDWRAYPRGTRQVLGGYSAGTRRVLGGYSEGTRRVLGGYSARDAQLLEFDEEGRVATVPFEAERRNLHERVLTSTEGRT